MLSHSQVLLCFSPPLSICNQFLSSETIPDLAPERESLLSSRQNVSCLLNTAANNNLDLHLLTLNLSTTTRDLFLSFQFVENRVYEEDEAEITKEGAKNAKVAAPRLSPFSRI